MKNACKHFALCTLTLILCLALAACGDSSDDVTGDDWRTSGVVAAEGTITHEGEGSVKVLVTVGPESAAFYRDEPEQELFDSVSFPVTVEDANADGSSVNIYSLGSFTYEMSLDEFDAQAEDYNSSDSSVDLSYLAGIWYLDGDLDADSYIYIDSSGGLWGLYERAPGAEATEVDGGFISAPTDVDDVYYAVSTTYQDVTYEFTLFDTDSIVWGGENDYYERLE